MKDGNDVAGSRAFKVLVALRRDIIKKATRRIREKGLRLYLGVHRLGEDIVKSQAKDERTEVVDVGDSAGVGTECAFCIHARLFTALIPRRVTGTVFEHFEILLIAKSAFTGPGLGFALRCPSP